MLVLVLAVVFVSAVIAAGTARSRRRSDAGLLWNLALAAGLGAAAVSFYRVTDLMAKGQIEGPYPLFALLVFYAGGLFSLASMKAERRR